MTEGEGQDPGVRANGTPLTGAEIAFLDEYSGTRSDPQALEEARAQTRYLQATTTMPDVPHIDEVIAALAAAGEPTDAVTVVAFVTNAIIEVPGTDESYTVRDWLVDGGDVSPVIELADSLRYGL